jgi:hypothetical protein
LNQDAINVICRDAAVVEADGAQPRVEGRRDARGVIRDLLDVLQHHPILVRQRHRPEVGRESLDEALIQRDPTQKLCVRLQSILAPVVAETTVVIISCWRRVSGRSGAIIAPKAAKAWCSASGISLLDLRLEKTLLLRGQGRSLGLYLDAMNVANVGVARSYIPRSGPNFGGPRTWTDPRTMRLGLRYTF